ncbi:capsular biosynthesis protein [Pseudomonas putida]|uniref:Capsular biosynthesis protein n=1 Tax=Pseudomonas putida TaxID=303 RepID=A0A7Y8D656_PSEPU|nr:glycosyltransferase family 2 protein [Pseudomonas putida]NWC84183.1 capsular biosynthesis protein [Pseudomonas putida]
MFIITMAGLSSRFFDAGYTVPKYQLELNGNTVFARSVLSFKKYFKTDKFVFVIRNIFDTATFVANEATQLGILDYEIVVLESETRGQAESAYLATSKFSADTPIYIFNIDTFRYNYTKPAFIEDCDGYLEVFNSEGSNWSFVLPDGTENVLQTTEKKRISDLCSDGLYYFKRKSVFETLFLEATNHQDTVLGEYYVAPLYNGLIARQGIVKYFKINNDQIDLCGTPDEYRALTKR